VSKYAARTPTLDISMSISKRATGGSRFLWVPQI
jgi:hypothetical protein